MYLHLGQETVVLLDDVVGIFDIDTSSVGKITRQFLARAEQELLVTNVSDELPKSFVLCNDPIGTRVYISQISSATLRKRAGFIDGLSRRWREQTFESEQPRGPDRPPDLG
ncbi:MAG: DUF370 domain-containing protein [Oscillospiraceae bacterium]